MSENTEPTPEAIEELRKILADHWAAGMAHSGAPAEWECVCDVALEMSDEAHQAHTAHEVLAAGWVSPEDHRAEVETAGDPWKVAADALCEWGEQQEERAKKAEIEVRAWRALRDRVEAAMDSDWHSGDELHDLITAALARPEQTRIANGDDEPPALEAS